MLREDHETLLPFVDNTYGVTDFLNTEIDMQPLMTFIKWEHHMHCNNQTSGCFVLTNIACLD